MLTISVAISKEFLVYPMNHTIVHPFQEDLKKALLHDKYKVNGKIGRGGSAKVYELENKADRKKFACKVISKVRYSNEKIFKEIKMMMTLKHPNIVEFLEHYENPKDMFIIMEQAKGGELYQTLKSHGAFEEPIAKNVIEAITSATMYVHKQNIVHRDIKLENILLKNIINPTKGKLQINVEDVLLIDFGLAKSLQTSESRTYSLCGSQYYVAPEVWLGRGYGLPVDLWGIGVVMYMVLTNSPPFYETETMKLRDAIVAGNYSLDTNLFKNVSSSGIDLLKKLLVLNPSKRIEPQAVLNHPSFQS